MAVTDVSILKKKRQQKKMMRFLKKFIIMFIIAAAIAAVVLTKDLWYPYLDGILTKIPSGNTSAELAEGEFPIAINGGADYQLETMDNAIAVLDDSHFIVYNNGAKQLFAQQHTLANPVMSVSSKKALIYDLGGTSFSLMSKYKEVYSKTTDSPILIAKLSENDYSAVVTKNDKFLSMLMIYDNNGENIFNYGSVTRIIDVTFNKDNSGCYITTISSEDGVLVSKMLYYRFDHIDYDAAGNPVPVWETEGLETLAVSVRLFGADNIVVFGDNLCAYYDVNGNFIKSYEYDFNLSGFDSEGNLAALIFKNTERKTTNLVTIDCLSGEISERKLEYIAENIQVSHNLVYVQKHNGITAYTAYGAVSSEVTLESDYDDFRKNNNHIFLLGYDEINRIDFS